MHPFEFYLKLGFEHISNLAGYDHILFLVALCAVYRMEQWRHILLLVTAFTIGHSVTLALVSLELFAIPSKIIKFLIPATILATALHNVLVPKSKERTWRMRQNYAMALFFGLIHG
ncbi:MAG: HupE/UreJ family protein, partial [Bacteroidota bacterium]